MKKIIILFCSLFLLNCANHSVVHDAEGHEIPLDHFKGKWVIINYWAAWCDACVHETPELNHFSEHLKNTNVVFYGFNYDHLSGSDLEQAISDIKITYPVLEEDPQVIWSLPDVNFLPVTFIINPEGHVAKQIVGSSTEESLQAALREAQSHP